MTLEEAIKEGKQSPIQVIATSVSSELEAKDGRKYFVFKVNDGLTSQSLYVWECNEFITGIKVGSLILMTAEVVKTGKTFFSCKQNSITLMPFDKLPADSILRAVKTSADPQLALKINELARSFVDLNVSHEGFKNLIYSITDMKVLDKLKNTPAGRGKHHAYKGGLLEHTYEMLSIYIKLFDLEIFENLRHEIVISGILLHDFFKYRDYADDDQFSITEDMVLVGHIFSGANFALKLMEKGEFTQLDKKLLVHTILAHHLTRDWGSPVPAATKEALLLHYIDQISAKFNAIDATNSMEWCPSMGTTIIKGY